MQNTSKSAFQPKHHPNILKRLRGHVLVLKKKRAREDEGGQRRAQVV